MHAEQLITSLLLDFFSNGFCPASKVSLSFYQNIKIITKQPLCAHLDCSFFYLLHNYISFSDITPVGGPPSPHWWGPQFFFFSVTVGVYVLSYMLSLLFLCFCSALYIWGLVLVSVANLQTTVCAE